MFSRKLWEHVRQAVWGRRPPDAPPSPGARYAVFLLIALLTLLTMLTHYLGMSVPPVVVLVCFLALAVTTGGLIVCAFARRSGRGWR